jgi:hypothetical protein
MKPEKKWPMFKKVGREQRKSRNPGARKVERPGCFWIPKNRDARA